MPEQYLEKILTARVYDVARETPLEYAKLLSERLNNHVYLKREDLQPVFSFKLRGAYNKIIHLPEKIRNKGVIAASAGNHAQGVALSAIKLSIPASIVMPKTTPDIKVNSVRHYKGVDVILHGNTYDEAYEHATQLAQETGMTFIHPFDDPEVIAGQGTIAPEIIKQLSEDIHAIFIPVGGGGLAAGMAAYIKLLHPQVKIIAVEPEDAACLHAAITAKERVVLDQVGLFADGVAVKQIGQETFRLLEKTVDEVMLISIDEMCAAIKDIFDDTRTIMEPAGALALAGLKKYVEAHQTTEQNLVAITSGANMNFDRLRHVAERAELGEQREALFAVTIPEQPGSFKKFCEAIGPRGITEFNYRYSDHSEAHIFVGVKMQQGGSEKNALIEKLSKKGYPLIDLSNNEVAKLHTRYMVGGHTNHAEHELLYRFEFPERPGALLRFLSKMGQNWNISLFHYRNHGSAFGRVLVGIQVPPNESDEFNAFLQNIGYRYWEESDNPAYHLFLN